MILITDNEPAVWRYCSQSCIANGITCIVPKDRSDWVSVLSHVDWFCREDVFETLHTLKHLTSCNVAIKRFTEHLDSIVISSEQRSSSVYI